MSLNTIGHSADGLAAPDDNDDKTRARDVALSHYFQFRVFIVVLATKWQADRQGTKANMFSDNYQVLFGDPIVTFVVDRLDEWTEVHCFRFPCSSNPECALWSWADFTKRAWIPAARG